MKKANTDIFTAAVTLEDTEKLLLGNYDAVKADKALMAAYKAAYDRTRSTHKTKYGRVYEHEAALSAAEFYAVVAGVLDLTALKIGRRKVRIHLELIYGWLWADGDTRETRAYLKALGFLYAPKRQQWFCKLDRKPNLDEYKGCALIVKDTAAVKAAKAEMAEKPKKRAAEMPKPAAKTTAKPAAKTAAKTTAKPAAAETKNRTQNPKSETKSKTATTGQAKTVLENHKRDMAEAAAKNSRKRNAKKVG